MDVKLFPNTGLVRLSQILAPNGPITAYPPTSLVHIKVRNLTSNDKPYKFSGFEGGFGQSEPCDVLAFHVPQATLRTNAGLLDMLAALRWL